MVESILLNIMKQDDERRKEDKKERKAKKWKREKEMKKAAKEEKPEGALTQPWFTLESSRWAREG